MQCNRYKDFESGKISQKEFEQHLEYCATCREAFRQHKEISQIAAGLNRSVEMPDMWDKIKSGLIDQRHQSRRQKRYLILKIAAVLLVLTLSGLYFLIPAQPDKPQSAILDDNALKQVLKTERQYEEAIARLEAVTALKLAEMDLELMLLYRDKLETIDNQIEQCRSASLRNPANYHIRKYLLAALRDKRETLKEIQDFQAKQKVSVKDS